MKQLEDLVELAFEEVAAWHKKNAKLCLEISKDDPRLNIDDRRRAHDAYKHHMASATAIQNKLNDQKRKIIQQYLGSLKDE